MAALLHPSETSALGRGGLRFPGAGTRGHRLPGLLRVSQAELGLALYCGCADKLALEGFMSWGDRVPAASRKRWRFGPIVWALLPLLTWGLLAPVPFVHAAVRLRTAGLWLVAGVYVVLWLVMGPAGALAQNPDVNEAVAGFSQLGLVIAATAHAFLLRERVFPPPAPPTIASDPAVAAALAARQRREQARAIAKGDPPWLASSASAVPTCPASSTTAAWSTSTTCRRRSWSTGSACPSRRRAGWWRRATISGASAVQPSSPSMPSFRRRPSRPSATACCSSAASRSASLR